MENSIFGRFEREIYLYWRVGYLVWPLPWRTSCVKGIGREICRKGYSFCQPVMRQEQKGMGEHGNKGSTKRDPVTHGNRQDLYGCLPHQRHSPFYPAGSGWQNHLCQYDPSVRSQDSREVQWTVRTIKLSLILNINLTIGFLREERAYSICFSQENDTERE